MLAAASCMEKLPCCCCAPYLSSSLPLPPLFPSFPLVRSLPSSSLLLFLSLFPTHSPHIPHFCVYVCVCPHDNWLCPRSRNCRSDSSLAGSHFPCHETFSRQLTPTLRFFICGWGLDSKSHKMLLCKETGWPVLQLIPTLILHPVTEQCRKR